MANRALYYNFSPEMVDESKVLLKLPRNTKITLLDFPVFITGYSWNREGAEISILSTVEYNGTESTNSQWITTADNNAENFIRVFSFLYSVDLKRSLDGFLILKEDSDFLESETAKEAFLKENANILKIKVFNQVMKDIKEHDENKYRLALSAIKYYVKSLELHNHELYEESFFSVYKSIELISNAIYSSVYGSIVNDRMDSVVRDFLKSFFDEEFKYDKNTKGTIDGIAHQTIMDQLKKTVTARRKIMMAIRHLNVPLSEASRNELGAGVQLRNNTAGHGTDQEKIKKKNTRSIDNDMIVFFMRLAKEIISRFLFGENYKITYLSCDLRD